MSNSAVLTASSSSTSGNPSEDLVAPSTRSLRGERSAGKGRRRRAIAEQRRAEQQDWSDFLHEIEEEVYAAPPRPPVGRRQLRRASRRSLNQDWTASFIDEDDGDVDVALGRITHQSPPVGRRQLSHASRHSLNQDWGSSFIDEDDGDAEVARALSLSLAEPGGGTQDFSLIGSRSLDMSYESLVMLENVKCTAPPAIVSGLTGHVFKKATKKGAATDCVEELCTICQVEYKRRDSYMLLPCLHTFHDACGSEWFLNHSKLCPVCKHDITEA